MSISPNANNDENSQRKFSFFKAPITNIIPDAEISLEDIAKKIRSNEYSESITKIRSIDDRERRNKLKKEILDFFTVSATFYFRKADKIKKISGLICLDFDHVDDPEKVKSILRDDEFLKPHLVCN